ncbi:MAG: uracil-DNA glycosylase [Pseudomonadota bacterium]
MNNQQANEKNMQQDRRTRILAEMRVGPLWQLKETGAAVVAGEPENFSAQRDERQLALPAARPQSPVLPAVPESPVLQSPPRQTASTTLEDAFAAAPEAPQQADAVVAPMAPAANGDALADRALQRTDAIAAMGWDELESSVAACRACGLCESRANTVFGVGDRKAQWLFVGEGPGYNENLQGEPFVGAAGHLLDNMMRGLDMQRGENTFIANVVKCRPTDAQGKDRPPTPQEAAACLPYLKRQIELIRPGVIVALGKTAAVSLLSLDPETAVGQLRGKVHRYAGVPLVVTYHPAYLLRKPVEKSKAWADLCLASSARAAQGGANAGADHA